MPQANGSLLAHDLLGRWTGSCPRTADGVGPEVDTTCSHSAFLHWWAGPCESTELVACTAKRGIDIDYRRVLRIKAGVSVSGIDDVVYMGDVVNSAALQPPWRRLKP